METSLQSAKTLNSPLPSPDFRLLFEASPTPLLLLLPKDPDFTVVAASDAFLKLMSLKRENLHGRNLSQIDRDSDRLLRLAASFRQVISSRSANRLIPYQSSWNAYHMPLFDSGGRLEYILQSLEEVSGQVCAENEAKTLLHQFQKSERRFRQLAETSGFGLAIASPDGGLSYVNETLLALLGYTRDEAQAGLLRWDRITPPEFAHLDAHAWTEILATGKCTPFEKVYIAKNGKRIPILVKGLLLESLSGEVEAAAFILDLSARNQSKRDAFMLRFDDLTRPLVDPVEITETAARLLGEHLQVNQCAYATVEPDQDTFNVTGEHNRGAASVVGRYSFSQFGTECLRLMRAGEEYVVVDSETDPRAVGSIESFRATQVRSVICVPLLKAGHLVAAMSVQQNTRREWLQDEVDLVRQVASRCWESIERARVTQELEAGGQRYRFLAESIPQMVWTATPDGMLDYVNGQGLRYFDAPEQAVLGAEWLSSVHPADRQPTIDNWQRSLGTGVPYEASFRLLRGSDRTWRWHLVRALPFLTEEGKILQWFGTCTDIETQKQAEAHLRQQWRTFDAALSHTPDLIYTFDVEGRFTYASRSLLALWQKSLDEIVGKDFLELEYPADLARRLSTEVQHVIETKRALRSRTPYTGPTGETRHYEYIFGPIFAASGKVEAVSGSTRDITEQKRIEDVIQEDRRRWRDLLLQIPASVAVLRGPEHRHEWVNASYAKLVGRPAGNLIGEPIHAVLPEVMSQGYGQMLDRVYQTGDPYVADEALVHLDEPANQSLYINFVCLPTRDSAGEIDGCFLHASDVTDLVVARKLVEESERQFRTLAESIPHLAWMADEAGEAFWYNRRWYDYTGATSDRTAGDDWQRLCASSILPDARKQWSESLASGDPFEMIVPLKGANGGFRTFLTRVEPVTDNQGRIVRWFGTHTDITNQRKTEEELRRVNSGLEEFAYVASHDLQEPLRMVNSYSQLLLKRLGPQINPDLEDYAGFIRTGVKRMETLLRDLLAYSRESHSPAEIDDSRADLNQALDRALALLESRIREAGAQVTHDPLPTVAGDTGQLSHVFQNLLSNAVKYCQVDQAPRIHISSRRDGHECIVSVKDNGIGFDPKYADRIFGLFKRLHRSSEYDGTGLGLAICKRILERSGGRIWVDSEIGVGSTFFFALPSVGSGE